MIVHVMMKMYTYLAINHLKMFTVSSWSETKPIKVLILVKFYEKPLSVKAVAIPHTSVTSCF